MRSFFNTEKEQELHPGIKIVIASGGSSCGVSFISELMATSLSKLGKVSLIELGKAHFYDSLAFEKRFLSRGFINFFEKIRNNEHILPTEKNEYGKINWIVRESGDNKALKAQELYRALYFPKEEYCIFDCSGLDFETCLNLLAEADVPIVVIDPLPSKLVENRDFLEKIRINLPDANLLVNKMNNGVHRAELVRYLGTKLFFSIPSVPLEYIYKAEYNSILISELNETKTLLSQTQDMLYKLFQ